MNDPFEIDWTQATRNLAFPDEMVWSMFHADGRCTICAGTQGVADNRPFTPRIGKRIDGTDMWHQAWSAAGTTIRIDMTGLDWRSSLRRRPGT